MKKLFPFLFLPLLISCFGPAVKVIPDFSGTGEKMALMIAPIIGDIDVDYNGSVQDEFGNGDKDTLIINFFKKNLPQALSSVTNFKSISWGELDPSIKLTEQRVEGNIKENLLLPSNNESIKFSNISEQPEFVLFIKELNIDKGMQSSDNTYGGNSIRYNAIKIEADFWLWDNIGKKVVMYGTAENAESECTICKQENWDDVMKQFSLSVFKTTLFFKGPKNRE